MDRINYTAEPWCPARVKRKRTADGVHHPWKLLCSILYIVSVTGIDENDRIMKVSIGDKDERREFIDLSTLYVCIVCSFENFGIIFFFFIGFVPMRSSTKLDLTFPR